MAFDPFVFASITAGAFVLGYLGCLVLKEVFGYNVGRRNDRKQ
ncbi:hypothetical protein [Hymenobacter sp. BT188]|nr:hypothetical protein [Hymenobacter sp. BT188]